MRAWNFWTTGNWRLCIIKGSYVFNERYDKEAAAAGRNEFVPKGITVRELPECTLGIEVGADIVDAWFADEVDVEAEGVTAVSAYKALRLTLNMKAGDGVTAVFYFSEV